MSYNSGCPLRSTWGTTLGEDKLGAGARILNTKVARRACAGCGPGKHSPAGDGWWWGKDCTPPPYPPTMGIYAQAIPPPFALGAWIAFPGTWEPQRRGGGGQTNYMSPAVGGSPKRRSKQHRCSNHPHEALWR